MIILYAVTGYLGAGLIFAIPFLIYGIGALDEAAKESPWSVKLTLLPGCIVFWPILLKKYIRVLKYGRHD
jgi:membrane-anchored glycerophosphoryl diester phosphodiesterase (GDPDase)